MSSKTLIKKLAGYRCQICGDEQGKIYPSGVEVRIQTHHITPRSQGGSRKVENLIVLCDLCHAVVHFQIWEKYFGLTKNNIDKNEMEKIKMEFNDYILSVGRYNKGFVESM